MSTNSTVLSDVRRVEEETEKHERQVQGIAQEQEQEQQDRHHYHYHRHHQITSEEGEEGKNGQQQAAGTQVAHILGTPPPVLPSPQFDTSFSLESMLESSGLGHKIEKIEKLNEEKGLLDEQLKEMQIRLARAEKKTEEMETKRRSQMLLRR